MGIDGGHRDESTYRKGLQSVSRGLGAHQMAVEAKRMSVLTQPGFKDTCSLTPTPSQD